MMIGCLLAEFLRCQVIRIEAGVGRRGPRGECVDGDMRLLGLKREWAQDRVRCLISGNRPTRASMETWTLNR